MHCGSISDRVLSAMIAELLIRYSSSMKSSVLLQERRARLKYAPDPRSILLLSRPGSIHRTSSASTKKPCYASWTLSCCSCWSIKLFEG